MMTWFEWDPVKATANERKHGIRFDDAMHVFEDPGARTAQTNRESGGGRRWALLEV